MRLDDRPWTEEECDLLVELRDDEAMEWPAIAAQLMRRPRTCEERYHVVKARRLAAAGLPARYNNKASQAALIDRERRAELRSGMDLTSTFFGDPPPGYSALDRKRQSQGAAP